MNKRKLRSILLRILNESMHIDPHTENDVVRQYENSLRDGDGDSWQVEVPNEPSYIEAVVDILYHRFGIEREEYMEEPDGEYMIFYGYGD